MFRPSKIWLAVIPIAVPAIYTIWQHRILVRRVQIKVKVDPPPDNLSLPEGILSNKSQYVISHEEASKAVATNTLPTELDTNDLLTRYMRYNMSSFARSPQSYVMWYLTKSPEARRTFQQSYIQSLDFKEGDLVCSTFKVTRRTATRVELLMNPHESYRGPVAHGMLAMGVERRGDQTVFLHELVMWRTKSEKSTILESRWSQWIHELIVCGLVDSGSRHLQNLVMPAK